MAKITFFLLIHMFISYSSNSTDSDLIPVNDNHKISLAEKVTLCAEFHSCISAIGYIGTIGVKERLITLNNSITTNNYTKDMIWTIQSRIMQIQIKPHEIHNNIESFQQITNILLEACEALQKEISLEDQLKIKDTQKRVIKKEESKAESQKNNDSEDDLIVIHSSPNNSESDDWELD